MSIRIKQGDKWTEVKVPIYTDATLTQKGQAADAQKVGELLTSTNERIDQVIDWVQDSDSALENMEQIIDNLPVKVSTDGFTDVLNTRLPLDISIKETTGYIDGSSDVEIAMNLSGNKKIQALLSFDKDNKPMSLQASNIACPITWSNIKVPSVDVGTTEEELSTFIIQNGAINTSDFGSYNEIKANGYDEDAAVGVRPCYVKREGTYLRLYGGSWVDPADNAMGGVVNRIGFEYKNSFDLTNYNKLVIDINYMNYAPIYLKLKKVGESSYSSKLIVGSAESKSDYTVEFDLSSYSGRYYIAIEARTANSYNNDEVQITNMYMIGKITSVVPDVLYMIGPSGGDTNTFGSFSGHRATINTNSFVLRWAGGNGDYVDDPQNPSTGGATPNLTHSKYVDFSEYKNVKIVASGSGSINSCHIGFINQSGKTISEKKLSMGTNNFNIESIVQTYGPNLKIRFKADLRNIGAQVTITEVSFSK